MILTFNGKFMSRGLNKVLGYEFAPTPDPYNPLNLPANTVRVRTSDGNVPFKGSSTSYETATPVPGTSDVYDVYKSGTDFTSFLYNSNNITEVLGANTNGITNMHYMFKTCGSLTSVALFDTSSVTNMSEMFEGCTSLSTLPLFDTSNVTNMYHMFGRCSSLTTAPLFNTSNVKNMNSMFVSCSQLTLVPLFDTSSATNMQAMFSGCVVVQSGALALYQQASSQANPPSEHRNTFNDCGVNTTTGFAELILIPASWGGEGV